MPKGQKRHRPVFRLGGGAVVLCSVLASLLTSTARASGPPVVGETWASQVASVSARVFAEVNPNGIFTTFHFEYIKRAEFEANVGSSKEGFSGAKRIPASADSNLGGGNSFTTVNEQLSFLSPGTAYLYRVVAKNSTTTTGPARELITQATGGGQTLADGRGWELVSPVEKDGGAVASPGSIAKGGVLQAAAQGSSITYGSTASFAGGSGAPPASQYLARRVAGGWSTENVTQPIFSGSYDASEAGVPYQLFSSDLDEAILLNGDHCRGEGSDCAVDNPPLPGTDAPAGYQDYYLREGGGFTALLGAANAGFLTLQPKAFDLRFAGASPDLEHPVLSTCAALTANATEVALGEGCDPAAQNLYEYSAGSGLSLVNLLPAQSTGTPGAAPAAQSAAVSADGSRVYFSEGGNLYLRAGGQTKQVDEDAGGGTFETASADGGVAFFLESEHLWRYQTSTGHATDITPSGGVQGVLGASADGSVVYFQNASALERWSSGTTTTVATGAEAAAKSDWPPTSGASRVSADGTELLFTSKQKLTGYDNTDLNSKEPDSEVFLYDAAGAGSLTCISCNPTLGRPSGPSSIPGSVPNGTAEGSTNSYEPRVLSADGRRVFFDSSDALAQADTDKSPDAYEWEAAGEGSCASAPGCVSLVSSGRTAGGAEFADASADGGDAFFLTAGSLVKEDDGAVDLYDARIGGGFSEPTSPIPCQGDSCQPLPSPPIDPTLTTLISGPGNPPPHFPKSKCPKGERKLRGKCAKGHKGKAKHRRRGRVGRRGR